MPGRSHTQISGGYYDYDRFLGYFPNKVTCLKGNLPYSVTGLKRCIVSSALDVGSNLPTTVMVLLFLTLELLGTA